MCFCFCLVGRFLPETPEEGTSARPFSSPVEEDVKTFAASMEPGLNFDARVSAGEKCHDFFDSTVK
jgi:hypothetical protein